MSHTTGCWPASEHKIVTEWPAAEVIFTLRFPAGTEYPEVEAFLDVFYILLAETAVWTGWQR